MKVYLETMGCQMNRLDSELIAGRLQSAGYEMVSQQRRADVILYNTCSVRRHAEDKVFSRLGADAQRKKSRRILVGVLGCMAQRLGDELFRRFPVVDLLCGPGQLSRLPDLIADASAGRRATALDPGRGSDPDRSAQERLEAMDRSRDPRNMPHPSQAFVRVMRGCDRFCTYCIVPYVRGPEHSRPPEAIEEEVRRLLAAGRSEITLLGQTVNRYRHEAPGRTTRFSDLLARLSPLPGLRRLRFVTSHPLDFGRDLLEAIRDLPNVCPYIHAPAQSGSDAVLKRMNRGYTRAQYDELVSAAKEIVPDVVLAGDFIAGFPGERDEDHAASMDLIRRTQYKNSFLFKYSHREGTLAARRYADDVPEAMKRRRHAELLQAQNEASLTHHRSYVGRTMEVLVAGPSRKAQAPLSESTVQLQGRTRGDHIVVFDGPGSLLGAYVNVRIRDADALTLFADPPTRAIAPT